MFKYISFRIRFLVSFLACYTVREMNKHFGLEAPDVESKQRKTTLVDDGDGGQRAQYCTRLATEPQSLCGQGLMEKLSCKK